MALPLCLSQQGAKIRGAGEYCEFPSNFLHGIVHSNAPADEG